MCVSANGNASGRGTGGPLSCAILTSESKLRRRVAPGHTLTGQSASPAGRARELITLLISSRYSTRRPVYYTPACQWSLRTHLFRLPSQLPQPLSCTHILSSLRRPRPRALPPISPRTTPTPCLPLQDGRAHRCPYTAANLILATHPWRQLTLLPKDSPACRGANASQSARAAENSSHANLLTRGRQSPRPRSTCARGGASQSVSREGRSHASRVGRTRAGNKGKRKQGQGGVRGRRE